MRTHSVDRLLEQHCYKSAAGLLQLVRFYVCYGVVYEEISIPGENLQMLFSAKPGAFFSHSSEAKPFLRV